MSEKIFELELIKQFKFNSAHFISHNDGREFLHGHNYRVSLKISSYDLNDNEICNKENLKKILTKECKNLHGKLILGKNNPNVTVKIGTSKKAAKKNFMQKQKSIKNSIW